MIHAAPTILNAYGTPPRKTHLCCALEHALVEQGFRVYFTLAFRLVQHLLVAKQDLRLDDELRKLDAFDATSKANLQLCLTSG
ncbi:MAG: ATP-binding protein [Deltaproteobacteria bacterium]|nr:ATP-binding protein [Deltaproteobacteria bacterium]